MKPRPIKMLQLFSFPGLTSSAGSRAGIWEAIAVHGLNEEKGPSWTLRLVAVWHGCEPIGTEWRVPENAFELLNAHRIDRAALRGVPVKI